ncbi:ROK family transcriptional regulator [Halobacillus sp. B23F22_1]|uniref:ROK family transcriptional regulator n=1 Tax=Halobacillus sp. B23F22_1 TaxID=3459514 RepID=UPI00373EBE47
MTKNSGWNQNTIKHGNKSLILETILNYGPISRAEIANKIRLNKGTVSSQVAELLHEELIYEKGPGKSNGGRRPLMLLFNQKAGYSIGIDIGVNYILGIRTDLQGTICEEVSVRFQNLSLDHMMNTLYEVIDNLIASSPYSKYHIVGIGIGVPGAVNKEGKILLAPNLGWQNVHLKQLVEEKYNFPVLIENEANAGAYGEKTFSHNQEKDIIYVSAGVGIGVGLILNGELYRGANGFSGEFGHMTIEGNGKNCRCGNKGCWEVYASEQALVPSSDFLQNNTDTLKDMITKARAGNKEAIQTFHSIGHYLGIGITNIINSFNPTRVIIGNRLTEAKEWIEQPLLQSTANRALWFQRNNLEVSFSELNTYSTALGMTAFSYESFLKGNQDYQKLMVNETNNLLR